MNLSQGSVIIICQQASPIIGDWQSIRNLASHCFCCLSGLGIPSMQSSQFCFPRTDPTFQVSFCKHLLFQLWLGLDFFCSLGHSFVVISSVSCSILHPILRPSILSNPSTYSLRCDIYLTRLFLFLTCCTTTYSWEREKSLFCACLKYCVLFLLAW